MTPAEDARLLLKAVLVLNAQEPPRTHSLQTMNQDLEACGETIPLVQELLALDDFAVLARYDAKSTPLPADRVRLLDPLDTPYQNLRKRAG